MLKEYALLAAALTLTLTAFAADPSTPTSKNARSAASNSAAGKGDKWQGVNKTAPGSIAKRQSNIQLLDEQRGEHTQWRFEGSGTPAPAPKGKTKNSPVNVKNYTGPASALSPAATPVEANPAVNPGPK
jgi:hypothetical protein